MAIKSRTLVPFLFTLCIGSAACSVQDESQAPSPMDAPTSAFITSVVPSTGTVEGGTTLDIEGFFPEAAYALKLGDIACASVTKESDQKLHCVTGNRGVREGEVDLVATNQAGATVTKERAFKYFCPWTYGPEGKTSCGAAPKSATPAPQAPSTPVAQFADPASPPSTSGDGPTNLNDTSDPPPGGTASVHIGTTGTGSAGVRMVAKSGLEPTDFSTRTPKVQIKIDGAINAKNIELRLGSSPTDYFAIRFASRQGQQWATDGDWVNVTLPFVSKYNKTVGSPNRASITYVAFALEDNATAPVGLHIGLVSAVEESTALPHGAVTFSFDDAHKSQLTVAAPLLAKAGFKANAYVTQGWVGKDTFMTVQDLKSLSKSGWEISAKAFDLAVSKAGFASTPIDQLEADMIAERAWLMANDFTGYNHCAYPHGSFTGTTNAVAVASKYFTSCRTIFSKVPENVIPDDSMKLRPFLVSSATKVDAVKLRIDEAATNNDWLILVFRGIGDSGATSEWPSSSFASIVEHVKASGMPVRTVSEVMSAR